MCSSRDEHGRERQDGKRPGEPASARTRLAALAPTKPNSRHQVKQALRALAASLMTVFRAAMAVQAMRVLAFSLVTVFSAAGALSAHAQAKPEKQTYPNIGRPATPAEVAAW